MLSSFFDMRLYYKRKILHWYSKNLIKITDLWLPPGTKLICRLLSEGKKQTGKTYIVSQKRKTNTYKKQYIWVPANGSRLHLLVSGALDQTILYLRGYTPLYQSIPSKERSNLVSRRIFFDRTRHISLILKK